MYKLFIMKKLLSILVIILTIALAVNGKHHRHGTDRGGINHTRVISLKNDSAYVEVGRLLKPSEVTNLMVNQNL